MASKWLGTTVSIDCGDVLGIYQGRVTAVNDVKQTISLSKAYRNGIQCTLPEITICAQDIQELVILKSSEKEGQTQTLDVTEKSIKTNIVEDGNEKRRLRTTGESQKSKQPTTPKKMENRRRWQDRDEACFSAPISNYILENDFDFEKNLALFDKQAVYDEIAAATNRPDLVNVTDVQPKKPANYRCDENVIDGTGPPVFRQIIIPNPGSREYVTDSGLLVPSIREEFRTKLFSICEKHGLSMTRMADMLGRAACEMVVQLLGGSHRLNLQNIHQKPRVVILAGSHFPGMQALCCGRHLVNRGANVNVFLPNNLRLTPSASTELNLFKLSSGTYITSIKDLPVDVVDIVVTALDDHAIMSPSRDQQLWIRATANWANHCKAPVLALDPPAEGPSITPKWSIVPGLPLAVENGGALYLCDIGIPQKIFRELGVEYASPFGAKFLIALHKAS